MFKIAFKYIGFRYRQHRRKTSEKLVVETTYGPVRGVKRISCWDDAYYSFERIPFAKPPVGELRFALLSYKVFWHGIHRTVLSRLKYASAPTYLYRFDFDSKHFNHFRNLVCGKGVRGVCHADELTYMFNNMFGTQKHPGTKEYSTIQRMIGMWSQFAYHSDPNFAGIEPTIWKPVQEDDVPMKCINISDDVTYIDLPDYQSIKVWDELYPADKLI